MSLIPLTPGQLRKDLTEISLVSRVLNAEPDNKSWFESITDTLFSDKPVQLPQVPIDTKKTWYSGLQKYVEKSPYGAAVMALVAVGSPIAVAVKMAIDANRAQPSVDVIEEVKPSSLIIEPIDETPCEVPLAAVEVPPAAVEVPPAAVEVPPAAVEVPPAAVEVPPAAVEVPPAKHTRRRKNVRQNARDMFNI
jgi:hypothetical protein